MSSSDPKPGPKPGPLLPAPESSPVPPSTWAKRTGFRPKFSGETTASHSGQLSLPASARATQPETHPDLEAGQPPLRPPPPVSAGEPDKKDKNDKPPPPQPQPPSAAAAPVKRRRDSDGGRTNGPVGGGGGGANGSGDPVRRQNRVEERVEVLPQSMDDDDLAARNLHMNYGLRDTPGLVPIGFYGLQHYLSMLGSLILVPLVIVPAMGGSHEDIANVVSTVLFVCGITTLLHTSFGSRLPLIQGPSFVFLAPALAIINSPEFQGLNGNNNFKHIMRELQGAIIIGSAFQAVLGYSGLMSLILRLINPVVVAPTIAAVGLSFYSYGFPLVGKCLEIGVVQILLVVIFALYLRKISILSHRIFLIYAVPLSLAITWAAAFLLTEAGAYTYKGCDPNVPISNVVSSHCRKYMTRMKYCRVDTSHALRSAPWFRFPYPLQWGVPIFTWKMSLVMCVVSIIASVDSVGSYHASSLLVASSPPTPGVVSRAIGLEGFTSLLAGLWGTGTGSTTLTENVHTIAVTKMGSRRVVELGACVLVILSLVGKVGGFIASIPQVMVASLLCFMWAMFTALGLSNLRYSEAGSSRNIIIVGLSLFFSLSVPAYFQQYGVSPNSNLSVPSYYQPYIVASHGPFKSQYKGVNYVMNTLLSMNMVIAFIMAVVLDNTVPGSRQERGVYVWSDGETVTREPALAKDYELPFRVGRFFRWVKWVGI
ncbi:Nucleobase-ascorbate transporter 12 [Raphanus sativus]|uniref:Nucleobase-ascorbate transporter 12 isoform X2 n=1 Tax=Raphanus sativus TaxID=3726 RepID=A0A6J0NKR2_RAPSA|nr:nucleobase-ascorbate transporter 12 isoform X2 [Raphanus sativus]KAJ4903126.1 Nucleobase-ascorbate transporter 12 [Raphanus sativus]